MSTNKREEIGQAILNLTEGIEFTTAIAAQCDALATLIGATFHMTGKSRSEAERLVRALAEDMAVKHIRRHWGTIDVASRYRQ